MDAEKPSQEPSSHKNFQHDSLASLGYDWERVANPDIAPKYPLKVYIPRTAEDVRRAVLETARLEQKLFVRSKGHSSNDLVLVDGGAVLVTELMNRVLHVDVENATVTVQGGAILADVDGYLREYGLGLQIIGDHNHITAGGFASVGGISPASHRRGMFLDNVLAVELVDWSGATRTIRKDENPTELARVLGSLGRHGVLTTLTLQVMRCDKWRTILHNQRTMSYRLDRFLEIAGESIQNPGDAVMERGLWLDYPVLGLRLEIGHFSKYLESPPASYKTFLNWFVYGCLHIIGYFSGWMPTLVNKILNAIGVLGIVYSPHYASIKNIESFTDKILDTKSEGPSRMLISLVPVSKFEHFFRGIHEIATRYRQTTGCFTFLAFYVKAINSPWLSPKGVRYFELMLYCGLEPQELSNDLLSKIVAEIDAFCIANGAFRYMHSKTSKDETTLAKIDPNAQYAEPASANKAAVTK